ncbi:MAG TPA: hypothetical protein GXX40_02625 [Firmicutes bacterium]|nr:hypothetical protein [Bacillota bacterium]
MATKLQIVREVLETGSALGEGAFDNARRGVEGRESAEYRALLPRMSG